jgi:glycosyltransferase involved in cell wall biosynthesis
MDLLLVPCNWNRDVFRAYGVVTPIAVVPHIVHPGPFGEKPHRSERVFYTIAPWTVREAIGNVLEAFCRAFETREKVRLVVKTSGQDFTRPRAARLFVGARSAARHVLRNYRNHPPIDIITRTLSDDQIDELHRAGDCFVSLGHGEGWSIPAFDAAAFGNPVVVPRFGGPLDYLSPDSPYLVDCRVAPVHDPRNKSSYSSDQNWAVPDLDAAARLLRAIDKRFEEARANAMTLARNIRERFAETAILGTLLSVL